MASIESASFASIVLEWLLRPLAASSLRSRRVRAPTLAPSRAQRMRSQHVVQQRAHARLREHLSLMSEPHSDGWEACESVLESVEVFRRGAEITRSVPLSAASAGSSSRSFPSSSTTARSASRSRAVRSWSAPSAHHRGRGSGGGSAARRAGGATRAAPPAPQHGPRARGAPRAPRPWGRPEHSRATGPRSRAPSPAGPRARSTLPARPTAAQTAVLRTRADATRPAGMRPCPWSPIVPF